MTMQRNTEPLLNELLARWHRWADGAVRVDDSLLRDFDALLAGMPPMFRAALVLQARNLACGYSVWSSPRVTPSIASRARARLRDALNADAPRWFGKQVVYLNERGNRIGESNPMAECTDRDVELALELHEAGFSLQQIADKMDVSKSCVRWWVCGGRRGQFPARVKEVG